MNFLVGALVLGISIRGSLSPGFFVVKYGFNFARDVIGNYYVLDDCLG